MLETFASGGIMMWPLLLIGIGILVLAGRAGIALNTSGAPTLFDQRMHSLLFWGAMCGVLGLLGTVVGLIQMGRMIQMSGSVTIPLIWSGVSVALVNLLFGLLLFTLALLLWYALRFRRSGVT